MRGKIFYLHEDDWGMVALVPAENREQCERLCGEARAFAEAHFAGNVAIGENQVPTYSAMFFVPAPEHPISTRAISLAELERLLGERFPRAREVQSGYSTYREKLPNCFAFGDPAAGVYGIQ